MKSSLYFVSTRIIAMCAILLSAASPAFAAAENPLGQFDGNTDVGSPEIAGSASYDAARQEYTLTGSGINMWANQDQFQFLWKRMKGDFILCARLQFVGNGVLPEL